VVVLVFVSLVLVVAALCFFVTRLRGGDFDHGERLSLLPLNDDDGGDEPDEDRDRRPANASKPEVDDSDADR
jgi:hypothetical protein